MKRITMTLLVAGALVACAHADPLPVPVITLIPASGNVSGDPGSVVGWGFSVTYSAPSDWLVLTGSEFTGSPVYGAYVDYLSLQTAPLYVAGPSPESSTVTQAWNRSAQLGTGEFDIDPTDPVGAQTPGDIVFHYAVFSVDPNAPNFDPDTDTVLADATVSVVADVTVSPEPASIGMMSAALIPLAFAAWRRRRGPGVARA